MTLAVRMLGGREPYDIYTWAQELFEGREYIEAGQVLEYLLEHHGSEPGLGEARELLARSYFHSAQLMRAVDTAHEILQGDPGNSYALLILVRSLQRAGRTDEALAAERLAAAYGVDVSRPGGSAAETG